MEAEARPRHGRTETVLSERDRNRLALIADMYGISMSAAIRVAIRAASEKLGLERETPDDFFRKDAK